MRAKRLCRRICIFIGISLLPVIFLYFNLPNVHISKGQSIPQNYKRRITLVTGLDFDPIEEQQRCVLTAEDKENYPNCRSKIEWLQQHWKTDSCFAEHGVNETLCSRRFYLSRFESHCPPINGTKKPEPFKPNLDMLELFRKMRDNLENYSFIQQRIRKLWKSWVRGVEELMEKYPNQFNSYRKLNIIVHLGFLMKESRLNFASKSKAGGPLGELVQWADLIATLHILGHNLYITTDKYTLLDNIRKFSSSSPCPGPDHLDLIVTDIIGFLRVIRRQKTFASQNACKFRFVDSFGTHAEFNNKKYFLSHRASYGGSFKNPWGGHGLKLQQYWTFYPHTSDNSFLGFVIEGDDEKPLFPRKSKKSALIYGKEQYMWTNISDVIETLSETHEIHATVADAALDNPVFHKVVNHGFLNQTQLSALLKSVEVFVGFGFPLEGPAPLEALAAGAAFINPRFNPSQSRLNTKFLAEKPTLRRWTSQVPYLEKLGEPYVYTIDVHNRGQLKAALEKISKQQIESFVPLDFRPLGMLLRVNMMLFQQDLCVSLPRFPPKKELQILSGSGSCDSVCSSKDLLCEPAYFNLVNTASHLKNFFFCSSIQTEDNVIAPFNCTLQSTENLFSCASDPNDQRLHRLCPCRDFHSEYNYFCKSCL